MHGVSARGRSRRPVWTVGSLAILRHWACRNSMDVLDRAVHGSSIIDRHYSEVGIFTIEAAFRGLVGMLKPVIADYAGLLQRGDDTRVKSFRPLGSICNHWSSAIGVGQTGISGTKREFADQAWAAVGGIDFDRRTGIAIIAIERFDVTMAPRGSTTPSDGGYANRQPSTR